ncbi:hypothetical protein PAXRUDRAFT_27207 [Paxillus rubicundulus Ve08.2h10]|uniref:Nucleoplasmin-like domain-containing protein n=1 Tax=Paxillus rubicundulus Ve08.2h10 TaxID=930991 RepID=A0A0D0DXF2_9AGAM|nr:hypothetical protein PAXRUDRAFT_27207 [Paxillus rubicundulus Ve08.2h10]
MSQKDQVRVVKVSLPTGLEIQGLSLTFGYQMHGSVVFELTVEPADHCSNQDKSLGSADEEEATSSTASEDGSKDDDSKEDDDKDDVPNLVAPKPQQAVSVPELEPSASYKRTVPAPTTPAKCPRMSMRSSK